MANSTNNTRTPQNSNPDTKKPGTNMPDASTKDNTGKPTNPGTDENRRQPEGGKDGKNNAPGTAPDAARTTANDSADAQPPQGDNS